MNGQRWVYAAASLVVSLCGCQVRDVLSPTTTVRDAPIAYGVVWNAWSFQPVSGATVEVFDRTVTTHADGRYGIFGMRSVPRLQSAVIRVSAPGYQQVVAAVDLVRDSIRIPPLFITPIAAAPLRLQQSHMHDSGGPRKSGNQEGINFTRTTPYAFPARVAVYAISGCGEAAQSAEWMMQEPFDVYTGTYDDERFSTNPLRGWIASNYPTTAGGTVSVKAGEYAQIIVEEFVDSYSGTETATHMVDGHPTGTQTIVFTFKRVRHVARAYYCPHNQGAY